MMYSITTYSGSLNQTGNGLALWCSNIPNTGIRPYINAIHTYEVPAMATKGFPHKGARVNRAKNAVKKTSTVMPKQAKPAIIKIMWAGVYLLKGMV